MRFNPVLISCFSFASAVLSNPRRPHQLNLPERSSVSPAVANSGQWAGAAWTLDPSNGIFNSVHAVFTVPNVEFVNDFDCFVNVLVAIDGHNVNGGSTAECPDQTMLGLGINLHASPQLHPPYIEAVILKTTGRDSFAPETIDIKISIGDSILLDIHNSSATTGHVFIENLTNNESANRDVQLKYPLCGQSAGWFVSDVMDGSGNTYTLADYGTVIFTGASAGTQGGASYSPDGATIVQNVGRKAENEAEGAYKMSTTTVTNDGALRIMYLKYQ
ncbi:concanavalin A-like lectin/glucanase domain-containing protein [Boletus edulis BED1]|uniref:Concanavalin A-like lectin/glucanase domain-containing protein n=1 Tax=Boletus edulis BED1 TaxID=1328754 RepID=A0AAD4G9M6_BOLED|nr:concanavalin A-like lectin/glucanase domain-containing protein [Boletus edulis BED1]